MSCTSGARNIIVKAGRLDVFVGNRRLEVRARGFCRDAFQDFRMGGLGVIARHLNREHAAVRQTRHQAGHELGMIRYPVERRIGKNEVRRSCVENPAISFSTQVMTGSSARALASISWDVSIPVMSAADHRSLSLIVTLPGPQPRSKFASVLGGLCAQASRARAGDDSARTPNKGWDPRPRVSRPVRRDPHRRPGVRRCWSATRSGMSCRSRSFGAGQVSRHGLRSNLWRWPNRAPCPTI